MSINSKFLVIVVTIVLVGTGIIFASSRTNKIADNNSSDDQTSGTVAGVSTSEPDAQSDSSYIEKLAEYLSEKGMVVYGTYWSQDSIDQKNLFGDFSDKIDYVECDRGGTNANPDECIARNIQTYPTWIYQDKQYVGILDLAELAKIVDFSTEPKTD